MGLRSRYEDLKLDLYLNGIFHQHLRWVFWGGGEGIIMRKSKRITKFVLNEAFFCILTILIRNVDKPLDFFKFRAYF